MVKREKSTTASPSQTAAALTAAFQSVNARADLPADALARIVVNQCTHETLLAIHAAIEEEIRFLAEVDTTIERARTFSWRTPQENPNG